jgi:hypothetical protein
MVHQKAANVSNEPVNSRSVARTRAIGMALAIAWAVALMVLAWPQARYWLNGAASCQAVPGHIVNIKC